MSAQPSGQELDLQTAPVRDCSGNAVPDGTIVTFTETYPGGQSTVDVPLKRDIAEVKMPAHRRGNIHRGERSGFGQSDPVGEVTMWRCSALVCASILLASGMVAAQPDVNVDTSQLKGPRASGRTNKAAAIRDYSSPGRG